MNDEALYFILVFIGGPMALTLAAKVIWFLVTGDWIVFPGAFDCTDGRADIC